MFYNKSSKPNSEWKTQGLRRRIPRHVAKKTMKFCEECNCPGFPFCFGRQDRTKIDTDAQKKGVCSRCVCSSCPLKRNGRWAFCIPCRENYYAMFHCRCHSWFQMDNVPFHQHKFDHRVYEGYFDIEKQRKGECDTCHAKLLPYSKREPCNFEKHYAMHEHLNEGNQEENITRNSPPSKLHFCFQCHLLKNFQCPFCIKKFHSSRMADRHIFNFHGELMGLNQNKAGCYICELRPEWEKLGQTRGLQKWIHMKIKSHENGTFVEDKMLGELDDAMLQEGEKNDKPSYSEIVQKNLQ